MSSILATFLLLTTHQTPQKLSSRTMGLNQNQITPKKQIKCLQLCQLATMMSFFFFFSEHGLNQRNIEADQNCYHQICMYSHCTFSQLKYNIHNNKNDGRKGSWRQYGGKGFTIIKNFRSGKGDHGGNSYNLRRWSWVKIKRKDKTFTVFISAYRQQVKFF